MAQDRMDRIVEQWERLRPHTDTSGVAVVGRVLRAARLLELALGRFFATFGLNRGEFDVLMSLLRAGSPHQLAPSELSDGLLLSTSAMTNRIDRLEAAGLVVREPDPRDRRGILVGLTDEGLRVIETVVDAYLPELERLLEPLSAEARQSLDGLLGRVLEHLHGLDVTDPRSAAVAVAGERVTDAVP